MKKKSIKPIKPITKYIIYPVIAGVIIFVLQLIIPNIWKNLAKVVSAIFIFLGSSVLIKWWVFILLLLVVLLFITGIIFLMIIFGKKPGLHWSDYKQDGIDGVLWKWDYDGNTLAADGFSAFCPNCKKRLLYSYEGYNSKYYCDRCDEFRFIKRGNHEDIIANLYREIERRIHTEEWKENFQKR